MKTLIIILFISLTFNLCEAQANPFSCKIGNSDSKTEETDKINLAFMGYAIMEKQRFAVVQLKNRQHILKNGQTLGAIKIIRFSPNSLYYQVGSTVFREPISRDTKKQFRQNTSRQDELFFDK